MEQDRSVFDMVFHDALWKLPEPWLLYPQMKVHMIINSKLVPSNNIPMNY